MIPIYMFVGKWGLIWKLKIPTNVLLNKARAKCWSLNTCKLVAIRHVLISLLQSVAHSVMAVRRLMLVLLAVYKLLDLTILIMRISITYRS